MEEIHYSIFQEILILIFSSELQHKGHTTYRRIPLRHWHKPV